MKPIAEDHLHKRGPQSLDPEEGWWERSRGGATLLNASAWLHLCELKKISTQDEDALTSCSCYRMLQIGQQ